MATLPVRYNYKVYRNGVYLGLLPNVISDFGYNQPINTTVVQTQVTCGLSPFEIEEPEILLGQDGEILQGEDDEVLVDEGLPLVGDNSYSQLIRNDNDIVIWEYSKWHPNGVKVFSGYISNILLNDDGSDSIVITCLTQGQDLANHIIPGQEVNAIDVSQEAADNAYVFLQDGSDYFRVAQSFVPNEELLTKIALYGNASDSSYPQTIRVRVWDDLNKYYGGGSPIGSVSNTLVGTTPSWYEFIFASPLSLVPARTYYFTVDGGDSHFYSLYTSASDHYPDGTGFYNISFPNIATSWFTFGSGFPAEDLCFRTYCVKQTTVATYQSVDVTDMLEDIWTSYTAENGLIAAPSGGWLPTGTIIESYSFNVNTVLEGLQKAKELAPADWYYYTDPALDELVWAQTATAANHTLIRKKHISKISLTITKEDIVNLGYFTGGDDGTGQNVFVKVEDAESQAENRVGLTRISDTRAQGAGGYQVGTVLLQNVIDKYRSQNYSGTIEIPDDLYDVNSLRLGQVVQIENIGNVIDPVLLQIVSKNRQKGLALIAVGILPKRQSAKVEQINKELSTLQTLNNPVLPS